MDRNLITLYELQLYVKSWGNSNNDRVKIFLENVFQIGLSKRYDDVFPMKEFEYGDLLVLDQEFMYKEYVNFLSSNENIDDVLFHIAENDYDKFQNICNDFAPKISDLRNLFEKEKSMKNALAQQEKYLLIIVL